MIKQLYCDTDMQNEMIDSNLGINAKNVMDLSNHNLMLTKLFQSQGTFDGFFNYNGQQVQEKFTLIFKKKPSQNTFDLALDKASSKLTLHGFGNNSMMGNFLLEGICEIV